MIGCYAWSWHPTMSSQPSNLHIIAFRLGIPVVPADAMLPKPVVPGAKLLPASDVWTRVKAQQIVRSICGSLSQYLRLVLIELRPKEHWKDSVVIDMQVTKPAGLLHARWPKESELNKFCQPKRPSAARWSKLIRGIRKHTGGKNHTARNPRAHETSPESRNRQRPQKEETREHLQGPSVKHRRHATSAAGLQRSQQKKKAGSSPSMPLLPSYHTGRSLSAARTHKKFDPWSVSSQATLCTRFRGPLQLDHSRLLLVQQLFKLWMQALGWSTGMCRPLGPAPYARGTASKRRNIAKLAKPPFYKMW